MVNLQTRVGVVLQRLMYKTLNLPPNHRLNKHVMLPGQAGNAAWDV